MLNIAVYIVFALLLVVCSLLLLVVLMQRPKNEGLGAAFGAQMTDQAFGAQTTDVLKKGTVLFGTLFMLLAFILGVLMNAQFKKTKSDLATQAPAPVATVATPEEQPQAEQPAAPASNLESYLQQTAAEAPAPAAEVPAEETPAPAEAEAPAVEAPAEAPAETPAA